MLVNTFLHFFICSFTLLPFTFLGSINVIINKLYWLRTNRAYHEHWSMLVTRNTVTRRHHVFIRLPYQALFVYNGTIIGITWSWKVQSCGLPFKADIKLVTNRCAWTIEWEQSEATSHQHCPQKVNLRKMGCGSSTKTDAHTDQNKPGEKPEEENKVLMTK